MPLPVRLRGASRRQRKDLQRRDAVLRAAVQQQMAVENAQTYIEWREQLAERGLPTPAVGLFQPPRPTFSHTLLAVAAPLLVLSVVRHIPYIEERLVGEAAWLTAWCALAVSVVMLHHVALRYRARATWGYVRRMRAGRIPFPDGKVYSMDVELPRLLARPVETLEDLAVLEAAYIRLWPSTNKPP